MKTSEDEGMTRKDARVNIWTRQLMQIEEIEGLEHFHQNCE